MAKPPRPQRPPQGFVVSSLPHCRGRPIRWHRNTQIQPQLNVGHLPWQMQRFFGWSFWMWLFVLPGFQGTWRIKHRSATPGDMGTWPCGHSKRGIHGGYQPNERRNFDSTFHSAPKCPKSLISSHAARTDLSSRDCIARSVPGTSWLRCTSAPIHLECSGNDSGNDQIVSSNHQVSSDVDLQPWLPKLRIEQLKSSASKQNTEVYMLRWGKNAQRPKLPSGMTTGPSKLDSHRPHLPERKRNIQLYPIYDPHLRLSHLWH